MTEIEWSLRGQCLEACNCTYLCPCIPTNRTAEPTQGDCKTVHTYRIDHGSFGDLLLDNLCFVLFFRTPGIMSEGNGQLGIIIDERASPEQHKALVSIARGEVGGSLAALNALVTEYLGVETRAIQLDINGLLWTAATEGAVDQVAEGVPSPVAPGEPIYLDNTGHRANPRIGLAQLRRNHMHAFGINWDDDSGTNSGAFAPFSWQGP